MPKLGLSSSLAGGSTGANLTIPSFRRDFAGVKTLNHGIGPDITFTRTGTATYFDATGTLTTATANVARFDHDPSTFESKGLLIEEGRTNSIRNSEATGGTDGSPGTLPTNYSFQNTIGLTRTLSFGTINGFSYVDCRYNGTTTGSGLLHFDPETTTAITAGSGQTWISSFYIALISGSFPTTNLTINTQGRTSGGSLVAGQSSTTTNLASGLTSSLQRYNSGSVTFNDSTVARVTSRISTQTIGSGVAVDFTLRIAAPQLEQGSFATSYIPTTSAAASRGADVAVVTPISSFFNPNEGTILNDFSVYVLDGATTLRGITQFTETGGITNRLQTGYRGNGTYSFSAVASNTLEMEIAAPTLVTANTICRAAQSYKSGDSARSFNNATITTSVSSITSATRERMRFGDNGTAMLNGHIRKVAYYPKRLSNAQLQALAT